MIHITSSPDYVVIQVAALSVSLYRGMLGLQYITPTHLLIAEERAVTPTMSPGMSVVPAPDTSAA